MIPHKQTVGYDGMGRNVGWPGLRGTSDVTIESATIENDDDDVLIITFSDSITMEDTTNWTVVKYEDGMPVVLTITSFSVSGAVVSFQLSESFTFGQLGIYNYDTGGNTYDSARRPLGDKGGDIDNNVLP